MKKILALFMAMILTVSCLAVNTFAVTLGGTEYTETVLKTLSEFTDREISAYTESEELGSSDPATWMADDTCYVKVALTNEVSGWKIKVNPVDIFIKSENAAFKNGSDYYFKAADLFEGWDAGWGKFVIQPSSSAPLTVETFSIVKLTEDAGTPEAPSVDIINADESIYTIKLQPANVDGEDGDETVVDGTHVIGNGWPGINFDDDNGNLATAVFTDGAYIKLTVSDESNGGPIAIHFDSYNYDVPYSKTVKDSETGYTSYYYSCKDMIEKYEAGTEGTPNTALSEAWKTININTGYDGRTFTWHNAEVVVFPATKMYEDSTLLVFEQMASGETIADGVTIISTWTNGSLVSWSTDPSVSSVLDILDQENVYLKVTGGKLNYVFLNGDSNGNVSAAGSTDTAQYFRGTDICATYPGEGALYDLMFDATDVTITAVEIVKLTDTAPGQEPDEGPDEGGEEPEEPDNLVTLGRKQYTETSKATLELLVSEISDGWTKIYDNLDVLAPVYNLSDGYVKMTISEQADWWRFGINTVTDDLKLSDVAEFTSGNTYYIPVADFFGAWTPSSGWIQIYVNSNPTTVFDSIEIVTLVEYVEPDPDAPDNLITLDRKQYTEEVSEEAAIPEGGAEAYDWWTEVLKNENDGIVNKIYAALAQENAYLRITTDTTFHSAVIQGDDLDNDENAKAEVEIMSGDMKSIIVDDNRVSYAKGSSIVAALEAQNVDPTDMWSIAIKSGDKTTTIVYAIDVVILTEYVPEGDGPEVPDNAKQTGWFVTGPETHAMIIGRAIITLPHEFNANGTCIYCRHHVEITEDEVEIEAAYESETEETEEDVVVEDENPVTGLALALLPAAAAMAIVALKRR